MLAPRDEKRKDPGEGSSTGGEPVSAELVQTELQRILASRAFCNSPRLSRFLRFIVEQTMQGHEDRIKEYLLGVDVFERGASYDPRIDPIVRVEAGRLRAKLQQYYESAGTQSSVIIELPKGRYIPSFQRRASPRVDTEPQARILTSVRHGTALLLLVAVAFGVMSYRLLHSAPSKLLATNRAHTASAASLDEARPAASGTLSSIAVLPFEDLSPRKNQGYFCDGMTETLIDALTKVEGLRVAARSSAFAVRETPWDIENIGAKLHVAAVLEGTVRKEERKVRISVHLVSVSDGLNIWSETYDRHVQDVFAIQDEIAGAIVNALSVNFLGPAKRASR
jgi:adenylate cyclase